jgi:hypothetical protein
MTNRYVSGLRAMGRFSGKGIYAKAQSRKGRKKRDEHDQEMSFLCAFAQELKPNPSSLLADPTHGRERLDSLEPDLSLPSCRDYLRDAFSVRPAAGSPIETRTGYEARADCRRFLADHGGAAGGCGKPSGDGNTALASPL